MVPRIPLVSYVLVNWNTERLLPRALDSIMEQDYGITEIFVVDNGSRNFDPASLERYPAVELISNPVNRGFAAANNQALCRCRGDYIILINCDACLEQGFTRSALACFAANPRIGTVVPKILRDDGSGVIDSTGHIMHTDRTPAHRGGGERDQGQYDAGGFVFGGTAAAVVYRREMLDSVAEGGAIDKGGRAFDERFFAYYEDVDLDWRANLAGWRAYYTPAATALHRAHGSGGRRRYLIRLRAEKNRYLMLARNDTAACQLAAFWPLLAYETWHLLKTLVQPWLWPAYLFLLAYLPGAWAYRFTQGRRRIIPPRDVAAQFMPRGFSPPPLAEPPKPALGLLERAADVQMRSTGQTETATAHTAPGTFPLTSVILVNYNGLKLTRRCLAALQQQTYPSLELIVVDNGSVVDEAELLAIGVPDVVTLRLGRNQGFSGGVNWGLSIARGDYIVLVNNDSVPEQDCIRNLVYAAQRTGAPAVSGRLIDITDEKDIQAALTGAHLELDPSGQYIGSLPARVAEAIAESHRNHGISLHGYGVADAYAGRDECFYPSGGLCILAREAVEPVLPELFPHSYFAYHEDVYLGMRLRARGGWVAKEPRAVAVHLAGSTARRLGRPKLRYLMERNRCLNQRGFYPGTVISALRPFTALQQCLYGLYLLARRPLDWLGWVAAHVWLLAHMGTVRHWRAQCRSEVQVPDEQWLGELSGQVRGNGGVLNSLSLAWCRRRGIPHREERTPPEQHGLHAQEK